MASYIARELHLAVLAVERTAHRRLERRRVAAGDLGEMAADGRGAVDPVALDLGALEQQAAQLEVVEPDRGAREVAHHQSVHRLALGQRSFEIVAHLN